MTSTRDTRALGTVVLAVPPFIGLERPALGVSVLKAAAKAHGFDCVVEYPSFRFAAHVGRELYDSVNDDRGLPPQAFVGEALFLDAIHGAGAWQRYADELLRDLDVDPERLEAFSRASATCAAFVAGEADRLLSQHPSLAVLGITSTFQQNLAGLALCAAIKAARPEVRTVFGGANCEGDMGVELLRSFPIVDFVMSGECDHAFPRLLEALDRGDPLDTVPSLVWRDGADSGVVRANDGEPVNDLDGTPVPDFDDYFVARDWYLALEGSRPIRTIGMLETARGCWWGARSHCTFCGLNGASMGFRSKSPARVMAEIRRLRGRYDTSYIEVVDNILDMRYFRSVIPALAGTDTRFFWEVKATLSRRQVAMLAAAGVRHIQPGIESLSDHVLELMGKGTKALQNVQLLKWCREYGIRPAWNVIFGFPGEVAQDYLDVVEVIEAITFLQPPEGVGRVRLDRFSPYHTRPSEYGIVNVRPAPAYRHLYPEGVDLHAIAYYFEFEYADGRVCNDDAAELRAVVERWRSTGAVGSLEQTNEGDDLVIVDRRAVPATYRLSGWRAELYRMCDAATDERELLVSGLDASDVADFVEWCKERRLMLSQGGRLLSLAVTTPARPIDADEPTTVGRGERRSLARRIPVAST
ncbi:MAG TPA: RiPP maturation radical SAM C-methyltransferase [Acidimicrobiales bacterium]